jgi:hypothetical protein
VIRSLRKGLSTIYLQYKLSGDSMGAKSFEAEYSAGIFTLRFTIHPVGENQMADEERLHSEELLSIQISDEFLIDKLSDQFTQYSDGISEFYLEILSKGKRFIFSVTQGASGLGFLPLLLKRLNG